MRLIVKTVGTAVSIRAWTGGRGIASLSCRVLVNIWLGSSHICYTELVVVNLITERPVQVYQLFIQLFIIDHLFWSTPWPKFPSVNVLVLLLCQFVQLLNLCVYILYHADFICTVQWKHLGSMWCYIDSMFV